MKYQECFYKGKSTLMEAGIEEAALDARLLLEHVCGTDRNYLLVHGDNEVSTEQENIFFACIIKRAKRVPLQHIIGSQNFMGLDFQVNEHVLIPRQDTEILVEEVLRQMTDGLRILDMCTGSGCILISLLHYSNGCRGVGVDISPEALEMAEKNAEGLLKGYAYRKHVSEQQADAISSNVRGTYAFIQSDLFEKVEEKYDIIVSNPPYIRSDVIETLMPEVRVHEPRQALDGWEDGLYFYRRIVEESRDHLVSGGLLYFEIGHDQAGEVRELMLAAGYRDIQVVQDYAGLDRVVYGRWI